MAARYAAWLIMTLMAVSAAAAADTPPYRHVYYLFSKDASEACEACYTPMIITREPIDKAHLAKGPVEGFAVVTYERDSLWAVPGATFVSACAGPQAEKSLRLLRWNGKDYRYQEVDKSEALSLMHHPEGTVPIARPLNPLSNAEAPGKMNTIEMQQGGIGSSPQKNGREERPLDAVAKDLSMTPSR